MNTKTTFTFVALAFMGLVSTASAQNTDASNVVGFAFLAGSMILFILLGLLAIAVALVPGIVASKRKHPNALAIWMISIFAGWTFVGWIVALVWACSNPAPPVALSDPQKSGSSVTS